MLTRTTARRSAAVLMVALVAMLLVATGGSARAAQSRTSVGTGQVSAAPHASRHVAAVVPSAHDHLPQHLDLAATPPLDDTAHAPHGLVPVVDRRTSFVASDVVAPVGRAPPAL